MESLFRGYWEGMEVGRGEKERDSCLFRITAEREETSLLQQEGRDWEWSELVS